MSAEQQVSSKSSSNKLPPTSSIATTKGKKISSLNDQFDDTDDDDDSDDNNASSSDNDQQNEDFSLKRFSPKPTNRDGPVTTVKLPSPKKGKGSPLQHRHTTKDTYKNPQAKVSIFFFKRFRHPNSIFV